MCWRRVTRMGAAPCARVPAPVCCLGRFLKRQVNQIVKERRAVCLWNACEAVPAVLPWLVSHVHLAMCMRETTWMRTAAPGHDMSPTT